MVCLEEISKVELNINLKSWSNGQTKCTSYAAYSSHGFCKDISKLYIGCHVREGNNIILRKILIK